MEITLPKAVLDGLPAPDSQGLVRVTAALRVHDDKADLVELNDTPMPDSDAESPSEDAGENGEEMPSPSDVAGQTQY